MSDATADVFFYGLFMDDDILRDQGICPRARRKAVVPGYRLAIGRRAMLLPQFGAQAFGMVFTLAEAEISTLYAGAGLELYRAQSVTAWLEDGKLAAVTTFNLREAPAVGESNLEYAGRLRAVLERLGFPAEYIRSIGCTLAAPLDYQVARPEEGFSKSQFHEATMDPTLSVAACRPPLP